MITGFELIQKVGLKGMEFKSTNGYTLEFEEAKAITLLILNEIIEAELFASDIIDLEYEVKKAKMGDQ
jgi:hypothetical protein